MNFNDRDKIIALTPLWKGERFPDGRPKVPEKPGLGFDDLNEEVLRQHINPNIPGYFEPTDEWNREFSNDRIWS